MRNVFENLAFDNELTGTERETIVCRLYAYVYKELSHKNVAFHDFEFVLNNEDNSYAPLFDNYSNEDLFYVLNDTQIVKGKKRFLKSRLVTATKSALFSFFKKEEAAYMETSFIISPKGKNKNNFIIKNNEDWSFYMISIPQPPSLNFEHIEII